MEMEIGSVAVVDGFSLLFLLAGSPSLSSLDLSSRGGFLYLRAFTKVVPFDDTMAAATIRARLYGRTKMVLPYSFPLSSYSSPFEPRFLGVIWNLVSSTLML